MKKDKIKKGKKCEIKKGVSELQMIATQKLPKQKKIKKKGKKGEKIKNEVSESQMIATQELPKKTYTKILASEVSELQLMRLRNSRRLN